MSYKKGVYAINIALILVAVAFIVMAVNFPQAYVKLSIQPSYYPIGVAGLLILFCLISIYDTYRQKEDHVVDFGNLKRVLPVIGICVLYAVAWKLTKQFYLVSFVATTALMYILNPQPNSLKKLIRSAVYSLTIQVVVYIVFTKMMNFKL